MIMNQETPSVIDLRGVTKKYGCNLACDAVDLTVRRGTTFGLLRPNGAGKDIYQQLSDSDPSNAWDRESLTWYTDQIKAAKTNQ